MNIKLNPMSWFKKSVPALTKKELFIAGVKAACTPKYLGSALVIGLVEGLAVEGVRIGFEWNARRRARNAACATCQAGTETPDAEQADAHIRQFRGRTEKMA